MKKILGISLVAVLAVSPLMANAAIPAGESGLASDAENVAIANAGKYYAGKTISDADRAATASAAYVKGAYNDAISAVNRVAATADGAAATVANYASDLAGKQNVSDSTVSTEQAAAHSLLTAGAGVAANLVSVADSAEDSASAITTLNGTVGTSGSVLNTVKLNAAGADYNNTTSGIQATTIQGAVDNVEGRVDQLETANANLGNTYATKTEVTANINDSTGSVTLAQGSGLTVAGTPTGTISSELANTAFTASVTLPASVDIMTDWSTGAVTTLALNNAASATTINGNLTSGVVNSTFNGTGITGGEATGTISNIDIVAPTPYVED